MLHKLETQGSNYTQDMAVKIDQLQQTSTCAGYKTTHRSPIMAMMKPTGISAAVKTMPNDFSGASKQEK